MRAALILLGASAALAETMKIDASSVELRSSEKRIVAEGEVVAVRGAYTIRCPRAVADYSEDAGKRRIDRVLAEGGVAVENGSRRARGEQALFEDADRTITLSGAPEIADGGGKVLGEKIVLHLDDDAVDIKRPRADLAGREPTLVTADHALARDNLTKVLFTGSVVARRGDAVVRAPRARSRSAADGRLINVVFEGGVTAVQGPRTAQSETAVYDATTRTVVMTGKPLLREGGDVVQGERITFFADGNKVEVVRASARIQGGKP